MFIQDLLSDRTCNINYNSKPKYSNSIFLQITQNNSKIEQLIKLFKDKKISKQCFLYKFDTHLFVLQNRKSNLILTI